MVGVIVPTDSADPPGSALCSCAAASGGNTPSFGEQAFASASFYCSNSIHSLPEYPIATPSRRNGPVVGVLLVV